MSHAFDAYVAAALYCREGAAFALGDGTVRFGGGQAVRAHDGAVLAACVHPSGEGLVTGGDDGRLVWSRPEGAVQLAETKGKWIDAVDASAASGLVVFAAGREVHVRDVADPAFARRFGHERTVAAVALDPKGRRLAAATYGGVALRFARIAEQTPVMLKWAGSHIGLAFSPDGKFLVSAMQENDLHGWRLADAKDMRMGGYPSKVKAIAFLAKGALMATSGARGAVVWPFAGAGGPMGKEAAEVGFDESALVSRVAARPAGSRLAAGLDDGRVWVADLQGRGLHFVKAEKGPPITALAMSPDGAQVAWGDEDGGAGVGAAAP
ncbi:MAG TPA: WD40 repeat domain-containing protein [Caulobacteraceae bacterium]|jgi:WD40 repeat protein|nr:WD40 repeat domain-containing protein [Caulobacteraceae bacterium]